MADIQFRIRSAVLPEEVSQLGKAVLVAHGVGGNGTLAILDGNDGLDTQLGSDTALERGNTTALDEEFQVVDEVIGAYLFPDRIELIEDGADAGAGFQQMVCQAQFHHHVE